MTNRALLAVKWMYLALRYRHWSLTCRGELPCDPRAHMSMETAREIAATFEEVSRG